MKIKPKKLSYMEFKDSFKNVPRIAIDLLISNSKNEIILTKRNIGPFLGYWHYPGSYLLKNELIIDCIKRIAKKELGLNFSSKTERNFKLLGAFENLEGDPRGHVMDLVYGIKLESQESELSPTEETLAIKFFSKIPKKIGFGHEKVLKKLGY